MAHALTIGDNTLTRRLGAPLAITLGSGAAVLAGVAAPVVATGAGLGGVVTVIVKVWRDHRREQARLERSRLELEHTRLEYESSRHANTQATIRQALQTVPPCLMVLMAPQTAIIALLIYSIVLLIYPRS